ncbi:MAG: peptidoglycan-binding protein [Candidatus Poribacteria bacterium]|nr:peptidoglycan-binding protein [Candidatus Poribacteria bacterium]
MRKYTVRRGDCISSVAHKYNLLLDTIWNDPANAQLKELRKDPNVLLPGDVVQVRNKELKEESIATGKRHKYRRKGLTETLEIQLLDPDQEPRSSVSYILTIDGDQRNGQTDGGGWLKEQIHPHAKQGKVELETGETYEFRLGTVDPIDSISGAQKSLMNLGYDCGDDAIGELGPGTENALRRYQADNGLQETGQIDDATRNSLSQTHRA